MRLTITQRETDVVFYIPTGLLLLLLLLLTAVILILSL